LRINCILLYSRIALLSIANFYLQTRLQVESAPSVLMKNIKKEEAEQLKAKLESGKLFNILQALFS
jgi:hypothetical protein